MTTDNSKFKIQNSKFPFFCGSGVALVMPFDENGINEVVLKDLVRFHHAQRTDALIINGSTGEAPTMTPAEQRRAIEVVVGQNSGRIPVVAGVGGSSTAGVVELARGAAEAGADAIRLSAPPYNKPTQQGIVAHFRAVLEAADLPLIVYNVPGRTACNILPETVEEIAEDPRVVGVKEASGDLSQVAELARRVGSRLAIYSGNDDQVLPVLSLGGQGVISVLANIAPADTSRMVHLYLGGDIGEARDLQLGYLPLIKTLFAEPNPTPVKAGVRALGFEVGPVRPPLQEISETGRAELVARMKEVGLSLGPDN